MYTNRSSLDISVDKVFLTCIFLTIIVAVNVTSVNSYLQYMDKDEGNTRSLTCMSYIIKTQIPCNALLNFITTEGNVYPLFESLNTLSCYNIVVRTFSSVEHWFFSPDAYIILAQNTSQLSTQMFELTNDFFWNPRTKIIVNIMNLKPDNLGKVRDVFDIFLKYLMSDVILVTSLHNITLLYTYYPFEKNCCGKKYNVVTIGECDNNVHELKMRKNRMKIDLLNCNITVLLQENYPTVLFNETKYQYFGKQVKGIEQYILLHLITRNKLKQQKILFSQNTDIGDVLPNGTATGILRYLQNSSADVMMAGLSLTKSRTRIFDYISGFHYNYYNIFTPSSKEEMWRNIFNEFGSETWILTLCTYLSVTFVCLKILSFEPSVSINPAHVFIAIFGLFFSENSSNVMWKVSRLRIVLILWVFFSFFIISFYNSDLYSFLANHVQKFKRFDVNHIDRLAFKPCISNKVRKHFLQAYNKEFKPNPYSECNETETAFDMVASRNNLICLDLSSAYNLLSHKYIADDGTRKIDKHALYSVGHVVGTTYLPRGFPLRDQLQIIATRLFEGGLLRYQVRRIKVKAHSHRIKLVNVVKRFTRLSLSDLRIPVYILLAGYVVSLICFVTEIIVEAYLTRPKYPFIL